MSNFLILVNIVPFPADKVLCGKRAEREPASGAEEHSPVMFNDYLITSSATTHINTTYKLRHGEIFIVFPVLRNRDYSKTVIPETILE